ncbi:MAG: LVIVD repeat-containing protein [Gaiellaceae bacterium]
MRKLPRVLALATVAVGLLAFPLAAGADHGTRPHTPNMHALGHSPHPASFFGAVAAERNINSDIAFWGNLIFNGNYDGFRIIKNDPGNPKEIVWQHCNGDQGDISVWGDILIRSWNSPAPAGRFCDGQPVPVGFEGFHIFDISNLQDPELIGSLPVPCGSHTSTLIPDLADNRVLVYNQTSGGPCPFITIVQVPLDDPGSASILRTEPLMEADACHDAGVILGDVNMAVCASHAHANVFDIGPNQWPGGSPEDPSFLYHIEEAGVGVGGNWHSAGFTWDGEVIILGWEPGGGAAPECEATDPPVKKSAFFYDSETGEKLGQWTLPRPQSSTENCTIHNYNVVPLQSGRYVLTVGNYQAGTWVAEFTDPANPRTVAWSDPPPLGQVTTPGGVLVNELGGAWSSYWYNNFIYESEITKGLHVFRLSDATTAGAVRLGHLNPQTQEFTIH